MIKTAIAWTKDLRTQVAENVLLVEKEFGGKSGAEKREIIVERLDALIKLPWVVDELANVDGIIIGIIVDKVCDALNILTDGDFANVKIDVKKLAAVVEAPVDNIIAAAAKRQTVDERLEALYAQYGIEAEAKEEKRAEDDDIGAALDVPVVPVNDKWDRCIGIVGVAEGGANFDVVGASPF